jgi:PAS domain-containing protein
VDIEGTLLAWNTAATELFGLPPWQASSHACFEVLRGLRRQGLAACSADCPVLAGLASHTVPRGADAILEPSGTPVRMHHLAVWDELDRPVAVLLLVGVGLSRLNSSPSGLISRRDNQHGPNDAAQR